MKPDDLCDDVDLMVGYVRGDMACFEALYNRHRNGLYRYLKRMCGDGPDVDEIYQEVWIKLIRSRDRYRRQASFKTFLYTIAHNQAIDHWRRRRFRDAQSSVSDIDQFESNERGPGDLVVSEQTKRRIKCALEQLPHDQREAFLLREEAGMSLQEIAQTTGVGAETAKSRLRYAVRKLRTLLGEER